MTEPAPAPPAGVEVATHSNERYLPGGHVSLLLVDDVVTTGATLEACAEVLKGAGARAVHGCAVARTPGRATLGAGAPGSGEIRD